MESYVAYQMVIRISGTDSLAIMSSAKELAQVTAARLGMDGANVNWGQGLWKGAWEFGANIEIVSRKPFSEEDLRLIRNHVVAMGLTAFVTTQEIGAHEAY